MCYNDHKIKEKDNNMSILIVEDEVQLAEAIKEILKRQKFQVDTVYDGCSGFEYALKGNYDLIILDIMLPEMNGLEVLQRLRQKNINTPILLLSAKSEIPDKIKGLDIGADDYMTKPFNADELVARVKALCRRKENYQGEILETSELQLDKNTYELKCGNNSIVLGAKEFQIMEFLLLNKGKILPKNHIQDKIWGYDCDSEYNNVEVYISFLRKKLSAIHSKTQIKSVRGVGYKLEVEDNVGN